MILKLYFREENTLDKSRLSTKSFWILFAAPGVVERLSEERPPKTDDEKFVFQVYQVYQVYQRNEKDELGEASVTKPEAVELSL